MNCNERSDLYQSPIRTHLVASRGRYGSYPSKRANSKPRKEFPALKIIKGIVYCG